MGHLSPVDVECLSEEYQMTLIGKIRALSMREKLARNIQDYNDTSPDVSSIQLGLLNTNWAGILKSVPYWKRMYQDKKVPKEFSSLEEYAFSISPVSRSLVQQQVAEMTSTEAPADFYHMSGGSTAEPIQIPVWASENVHTGFDIWAGEKLVWG